LQAPPIGRFVPLSVALSAAKAKENRDPDWGDLDNSEIMTQASIEQAKEKVRMKIKNFSIKYHLKNCFI